MIKLKLVEKYFRRFIRCLILLSLFAVTAVCSADDSVATPLMWNLKHFNEHFVGRKVFLQNMKDHFFKQNNNLLIISGDGGMGKAEVIQRYAEKHQAIYNIVWWLDIKGNLKEQYRNFAHEWNRIVYDDPKKHLLQIDYDNLNEDELIEQVNDRLRITKLNWLIILDKVQEPPDAIKYVPNKKQGSKAYGHIIISTKNSTLHDYNVMHLGKLAREESIDLLYKTTRENNPIKADLLSSTLGDNPLAIARAGLFIASYYPMSIEEYNHLFKNDRPKLQEAERQLQKQRTKFNSYKATIFSTHSRNIEEVKKESHIAYELLAIVAFLDNKFIPKNILREYYRAKKPNDSTDIEFNNTLSLLMKHSLLEQDNNLSHLDISSVNINQDKTNDSHNNQRKMNYISKDPFFKIEALTQLSLQDILGNNQEREHYLNQAIITINHLLADEGKLEGEVADKVADEATDEAGESSTLEEEKERTTTVTATSTKSHYFSHLITLSKHAIQFKLDKPEVRKLHLHAIEHILSSQKNSQADNGNNPQEVRMLLSAIEEINEQELKHNPEIATDDLSDAYARLAIVNAKLQQFNEALRYFALHQHKFGEEHSRTIKLMKYFTDNNVDVGF
jgi:hypothetical protein